MSSIPRNLVTCLQAFPIAAALCLTPPAHAQGLGLGIYSQLAQTPVVEFVNDITKRRVLLSDESEIAFVERGAAGPGWRKSGLNISVAKESFGQLGSVCRFYAPSVNSHFFTLDPNECALLKAPGTGWFYEGIAFTAVAPEGESCAGKGDLSLTPVYRLYNNRAAFGDTTHRYTPDLTVRKALTDRGWIYERVAFCARSTAYANPVYAVETRKVLAHQECENESLNLGACVGLKHTVGMPYFAALNQQAGPPPPPFVTGRVITPFELTFASGDIITPVASLSAQRIAERSFVLLPPAPENTVSLPGTPSTPFTNLHGGHGLYLNAIDRSEPAKFPAMSINPAYQFVTTAPIGNGVDQRVMPWRDAVVRNLELSFNLYVAYVRRATTSSHAISHPKLELVDTRSRRSVLITLAGAQTVPLPNNEQEDYFAPDIDTGKIIVSTSFRANPSFGERIIGGSFFCDAGISTHRCDQGGDGRFAFSLRPADISYVIAKARRLDPALSNNIADYAIANFSFNNEILNEAELGVRLTDYRLEIKEQQY